MFITKAEGISHANQAGRGHLNSLEQLLSKLVQGQVGAKLETEAGSGIITGTGTIYRSSVHRQGGIIRTNILVDLTGLRSTAAGDIIGVDGTTDPCHLGQIPFGLCGTPLAGSMKCLEVPTGGDPDIDLYAADEATGSEDDAITGLTETQLTNGGDHVLGDEDIMTAFPTTGQYLYLVAGATTDADYTAGKFLIELLGYDA